MAVPDACATPGCGKPIVARNLCTAHYGQWRRRTHPIDRGQSRHLSPSAAGLLRKLVQRGLAEDAVLAAAALIVVLEEDRADETAAKRRLMDMQERGMSARRIQYKLRRTALPLSQ
jgi:hypothetical protein